MQQQHYKAGDQVNLRANFAGVRSVQSLCRIVSVLNCTPYVKRQSVTVFQVFDCNSPLVAQPS